MFPKEQKKFWSTIKPYIISSRKSTQNGSGRIVLKDNGKVIRDQQEVAETLNKFFTSTTQTSGTNKCKPDLTHISQNLNNVPKLSLEKTSATEVQLFCQQLCLKNTA